MKEKNDNRISIGNKNKINSSIIGNNIHTNISTERNKKINTWYTNLFWKIVIPVVVAIISALIIWKLGIK